MSLQSKILGVLLIVVVVAIGVQIYLENRHCQFSSGTSASTSSMQRYDAKFDPCYIDRPTSATEKILPFSLALLIGLSFVSGVVDLRGHKKRERTYE